MPSPSDNIINSLWIFQVKENPDSSVNRLKARLIMNEANQVEGVDYNDIFSLVIKPVLVQLILTLVVTHDWPLRQLDIGNAFLNGVLEETILLW